MGGEFLDPYFVVLLPEYVYVGGGNVVEHDLLVFRGKKRAPLVVEFASSPDEPVEKQFRHRLLWRRFAEIVYTCGKERPEVAGLSSIDEEAPYQPPSYAESVGKAYRQLPDLAHINYFVATSSPEYLELLARDLIHAGAAIIHRDAFLGSYLVEKGRALLEEEFCDAAVNTPDPSCQSQRQVQPGDSQSSGSHSQYDAAVVILPLFRGERPEPYVFYLATARKLVENIPTVYIVADKLGEANIAVEFMCRKATCAEDLLEVVKSLDSSGNRKKVLVVVRDYEKSKFDKFLDELKNRGVEVEVAYVPEFLFEFESGKAPTTAYTCPKMHQHEVNDVVDLLKRFYMTESEDRVRSLVDRSCRCHQCDFKISL